MMASQDRPLTALETRAYEQFDRLLDRGELFWNPSPEITYPETPFPVYFRVSNSTASKPYNPNDSSKKPGFLDSDPDFTLLSSVPPAHKLILNKFCWTRPQLILHTAAFASQTEPLTFADLTASYEILMKLGPRWMVIFNGGPDAGSSVAHKHLQAMLKPDWETFVDVALEEDRAARWAKEVPFDHRFHSFSSKSSSSPTDNPSSFTADQIHSIYQKLCDEMSIPGKYPAHNIVLTHDWLLVMPRRSSNVDGLCMAGANGMLGQLWLKAKEQMVHWKKLGPMNVLARFGAPVTFPV